MTTLLSRLFKSTLLRTLLPAIAGFVGYGGWGGLCNMKHGWQISLQAGLIQGSFSFAITLTLNSMLEAIYRRTLSKWFGFLACVLGQVGVATGIHHIAGTPEILPTIAPGAIIGSFYIYLYVNRLESLQVLESDMTSGEMDSEQ